MIWDSEDELLEQLAEWAPLPDESDPRWWSLGEDGDALWLEVDRLMAAAHASGLNGWRRVAVRVWELAPDWDATGVMLDLRHGPEKAFLESPGGAEELAVALEPLSAHERAGTRLWVVHELGYLRQVESLPSLVARLHDEHPRVAAEARSAIELLAEDHPQARGIV